MFNSKFNWRVGLGAVALAAAAMSGQAWASTVTTLNSGMLSSSPQSYAIQGVTAASGTITVSGNVSYASPAATVGSYLLTFTLPPGVTFSTTPSATTTVPTNCTVALSGGGSGSSSAIFTVTQVVATAAPGCVVDLAAFNVAGATALENTTTISGNLNSGGFNISSQVSGSNAGVANEVTSTPIGLASSATALAFTTVPGSQSAKAVVIDVSSPSLGTKWLPNGGSDQAYIDLAAFSYEVNTATLNSTATGPYNFPGTSASITVNGNFAGITAAYLDGHNVTTLCASTASTEAAVPGSISGVISGGTLTFSGVGANLGGSNNPFAANNAGMPAVEDVCLYSGTQVIAPNPSWALAAITIAPTTNQTEGDPTSQFDTYNYNGLVQQILYSSNDSQYPAYLRIVNNTASPVQVLASVQGDSGSLGGTTVETALPANSNDLVPVATIIANAGVTTPTERTSMTIFAPSVTSCVNNAAVGGGGNSCSVSVSQLQLSPDGTLVQLGSGSSP